MLAERLKLFATLTSKRSDGRRVTKITGAAISIAALGIVAGLMVSPAAAVRDLPCGPAPEMMTKGLEAYKQSRYEIAVPALQCVVAKDDGLQKLHAEFFLARIFSDDTGGFVDHTRAYMLFQGLADTIDTVDPEDVRRAPFVAKALTAVGSYVRRGLPEIGLKPDLERSVEIIRHGATFFNEPDAQFELAKMHLVGQGVPADVPLGLHYVQKLVQDSHPGAQAYLADLYWRGKYVPVDRTRALALSKLATENSTPSDKLWIEDGFQNIYCGTPAADRTKAAELAGAFRRTFARGPNLDRTAPPLPPSQAMGRTELRLSRTCSNGESIDMEMRSAIGQPPLASTMTQSVPQQTTPAGMRSPATR